MHETILSILPYGINGLALGLNVAIVALALALIWRTVGMLDFGIGAVYLASAYTLWLAKSAGLPLVVGMAVAIAAGVFFSVLNYLVVYRFFIKRNAPLFVLVVVSLSLFVATENFVAAILSAERFYIIDSILLGWTLLGTRLNVAQIAKMAISLITLGAIAMFCLHSRAGLAILAVADNPRLAQGMGIELDRAYIRTFAIAGFIVSLAAIPDVAESGVDPYVAATPLFLALAAIIIGGLGAFKNPVRGAVMLGLAFHLAVWAFASRWQEVIAYSFVMAALIIRPQGLFGGVSTPTRP